MTYKLAQLQMAQTGYKEDRMALKLTLTTPHGISLADSYCNIDYFSFTKRHDGVIFNMVFYRDENAYLEGLPALPDMMIVGNIPIEEINLQGNILEQIYNYAKEKAKLATDNDYFFEAQKTQDEPLNRDMQYALLKSAIDV